MIALLGRISDDTAFLFILPMMLMYVVGAALMVIGLWRAGDINLWAVAAPRKCYNAVRLSSVTDPSWRRPQTPFTCGSMVLPVLSVFRFCALRAQKRNTKRIKYR